MILMGPLQFKSFCASVNFSDAPFLFLNVAFAWNILCQQKRTLPKSMLGYQIVFHILPELKS